VRLSGDADAQRPSQGVYLQFKRAFGYFTMPGPSKEAIAFPLEVNNDGTVQVEITVDGKRLRRLARGMPQQSGRDRFWTKIAALRNAGEPFSHLFAKAAKVQKLPPVARAKLTLHKRTDQGSETIPGEYDVKILGIVRRNGA